ncbi:MAG: ATP-binding protein [Caldilinea sp.]|uniref:ATP-binding protein n=1 Tax=Caldilinea sp. TaxID=2293560 RepID=UPI002CD8DAC1|nr:HAMP domain-containing protein [Anaerolineales bacterium]HQY94516.1 ATP-binding protein [Caldilinea sp.]HRA65034.1 ATP-binding protein [Caldilinea sp.]
MKTFTWRSIQHTVRYRWRYVVSVFISLCIIVTLLIWFVVQEQPTLPQLVLAGLGAAASATLLLIGALDVSSGRVRQIAATIEQIAAGDLDARMTARGPGDIGALSRAVNSMAERLQRQSRKRNRERDRLHTVLHIMNDGVIILNKHGYVSVLNPAAARLLNVLDKDALNKSFVQVVKDYRIAEVWLACIKEANEQSATLELSNDAYVRVIVAPFLRGASNGYLVLLQDLSHIHRLEAVRRDFISNLSHELRTPLASIKALVETLRDGAIEDPPAAERFFGHMEVEVDEMTQMVQELLELSRIESGQAPLRLFPTTVAKLVEPAVERLHAQAGRANLSLNLVLGPNLPEVMVDADRVGTVILNLVHNAIKFTPAEGQVTVSARAVADAVVISVADTGTGIPAEDVPRIFERFYKADRARSGGGTGLGLAIAKHTVHAHNGRIWVESTEGVGSTFSFTLPLVNLPLTHN